jgi:ABC-type transporter Mla MlaB component
MNGVQVSGQNGETQVVFEPQLDVAQTRGLYRELDSALTTRKPLALDASHVERIDTAALQLLAAFCCAARDAGVAVRWRGASKALRSAAAFLDLRQTLGDPA